MGFGALFWVLHGVRRVGLDICMACDWVGLVVDRYTRLDNRLTLRYARCARLGGGFGPVGAIKRR